MAEQIVVVGGTSGIGRRLAEVYAGRGDDVVLTGRSAERADAVAREIGGAARAMAVDLSEPESIAESVRDVGSVRHLIVAAIERDENSVREYDIRRAARLVTLKLIGYTEVVHALMSRLLPDASIVLFGGLAKDRPYPGSTTVTTVNGGVTGLVRTLAVELAPVRVNGLHPGIVGDTPAWSGKPAEVLERIVARTPTGRLVATDDIVDAARFLLENRSVNGVNLAVDGGWLLQ
jgi:NAD(P)-dependent dehydrogenase (short-subunit alcohol dehydrogenase family)